MQFDSDATEMWCKYCHDYTNADTDDFGDIYCCACGALIWCSDTEDTIYTL